MLTTIGWLVTLEYDRTGSRLVVFLLVAQGTMAFVVWCVDAMSTDIHNRPLRRLLRSVFWLKAITDYMRDEDNIKIAHASLTVWILLTTGWLLSLGTDRILRPLGLRAVIWESFRERKPFPGQDPFVVPYEGAFLLIQTARNDRRIVIKRFTDLDRMHRYTTTVLWKPLRGSLRGRNLWAPELHEINGRWYVYYAACDGRTRTTGCTSSRPTTPSGRTTGWGRSAIPATTRGPST